MLNKLKDDILRLLKDDEEFRYAVVGLLGLQKLEEVIARLTDSHIELKNITARLTDIQARIEARLARVEEEQVSIKARMDRIEEAVIELKNIVAKMEERLAKVEERQAKVEERLEEHDRKFNAILEELSIHRAKLEEHDRKFNAILEEISIHRAKLEEHDRKFNAILEEIREMRLDIKDLRSEMKKVSDKYGLTLEDLAVSKLPLRLQEEGIVVNKRDIRTRYSIIVRNKEREVDIYTEGKIDGKTVRIIGEVKSIIDKRDVKLFYNRFKEYDAIKCILGHTIRPDAEDIAKELNVRLYSVIG
jgi:DNA repair exonuclease SbcCD ATPase subunit